MFQISKEWIGWNKIIRVSWKNLKYIAWGQIKEEYEKIDGDKK